MAYVEHSVVSSVEDPHHVDADPDTACDLDGDADPDPDPASACHFDADPDSDPAFHF